MYKFYIDEETYNYLISWSEEFKKYVLDCPAVAPKFMVVCKDKRITEDLVLYVTSTRYGYKFNFSLNKTLVAKGRILRTPDGENDFRIEYDLSTTAQREFEDENFSDKDKALNTVLPYFINMYCNAFIMCNAFLMYGNVVDEKHIIATGRNSGSDKIIVFRPCNDKIYAVPVGYHKSPEGVFSVRGHLRHYKKTGKVVWIEGYLKGTDKDDEQEE